MDAAGQRRRRARSSSRPTARCCAGTARPRPTASGSRTPTRTSSSGCSNVEAKKNMRLADCRLRRLRRLAWSPDSRWLAYASPAPNTFHAARSSTTSTTATITAADHRPLRQLLARPGAPTASGSTSSPTAHFESLVRAPVGPAPARAVLRPADARSTARAQEGRALAVPARRRAATRRKRRRGRRSAERDEAGRRETGGGDAEPRKPRAGAAPWTIDLDGIEARLIEVPAPRGQLRRALDVDGEAALLSCRSETTLERKRALKTLAIDNKPTPRRRRSSRTSAATSCRADGKKLLVRKDDDFYVIDAAAKAPAGAISARARSTSTGWTFPLDPREEWRQMFTEAWRLERDYFYDRNMHGVDWHGDARQVPAAGRSRHRPRRAERPARADGRRAVGAAHLRARRRPAHAARTRSSRRRSARGSRATTPAGGYRVEHIYQTDPGPARSGCRRSRGPASTSPTATSSSRSTASRRSRRPTSARCCATRPASRCCCASSRRARPRSRDVDRHADHARSSEADLRYDEWEYTRRLRGRGAGPGPHRLRAPARDGRRQHRRVGARVLPGLQPRGPDHRRAPQPRRQHRQLDPREAAAQGLVLLAAARRQAVLEHAVRLPRPHGRAVRRAHRLRRRGVHRRASAGWASAR